MSLVAAKTDNRLIMRQLQRNSKTKVNIWTHTDTHRVKREPRYLQHDNTSYQTARTLINAAERQLTAKAAANRAVTGTKTEPQHYERRDTTVHESVPTDSA